MNHSDTKKVEDEQNQKETPPSLNVLPLELGWSNYNAGMLPRARGTLRGVRARSRGYCVSENHSGLLKCTPHHFFRALTHPPTHPPTHLLAHPNTPGIGHGAECSVRSSVVHGRLQHTIVTVQTVHRLPLRNQITELNTTQQSARQKYKKTAPNRAPPRTHSCHQQCTSSSSGLAQLFGLPPSDAGRVGSE